MTPKLTRHAEEMLRERGILAAWLDQAVTSPERTEQHADGTTHLLRRIEAFGNRWLRVVVSPGEDPTVITTFFDRRVQ